jgi:hypothetical protein
MAAAHQKILDWMFVRSVRGFTGHYIKDRLRRRRSGLAIVSWCSTLALQAALLCANHGNQRSNVVPIKRYSTV